MKVSPLLHSMACQHLCYCLSHVSSKLCPAGVFTEIDPIKGIFSKSPGVCISKLYSIAQPLLTISTSALHISRPLNPLMSTFFLMHAGRGQESRTNRAWGISLYSRGALINLDTVKRVFCYVLRCTCQKHDRSN